MTLTDREWGLLMRCLMDSENRATNEARISDMPIRFSHRLDHRAAQIKKIRLKLRAQRKAAK